MCDEDLGSVYERTKVQRVLRIGAQCVGRTNSEAYDDQGSV